MFVDVGGDHAHAFLVGDLEFWEEAWGGDAHETAGCAEFLEDVEEEDEAFDALDAQHFGHDVGDDVSGASGDVEAVGGLLEEALDVVHLCPLEPVVAEEVGVEVDVDGVDFVDGGAWGGVVAVVVWEVGAEEDEVAFL